MYYQDTGKKTYIIITSIHVIVLMVPIMEGVVTAFYPGDPIGRILIGATKKQCRVTSKQMVINPIHLSYQQP